MPVDVVVLNPGFLGFGAFGPRHRPLIEYFARVKDWLARGLPHETRFVSHEPPPTSSLALRVSRLHDRVQSLLREGVQGRTVRKVHIVGHSTGGVDARLLANRKYLWPGGPEASARDELCARLGAIVTLAAPLHGTPVASRLTTTMELSIPALFLLSIIASSHGIRLAGHLGDAYRTAKKLLLQRSTPNEDLIASLAGVDDETANQIRRFLDEIVRDHRLVGDLTVEAMRELNAAIAGGDPASLACFVTVGPAPGLHLSDAIALARAPILRSLYVGGYGLAAVPPPVNSRARVPDGLWVGPHSSRFRADDPRGNDGLVPLWSQTAEGRAAGLVAGDHLDPIGRYESAGFTIFSSGSRFDDARFRALWSAVARVISAEM